MSDAKAIDLMNYPLQCMRVMDLADSPEFRQMAQTTFAALFPTGRFPTAPGFPANEVEEKLYKHTYGSLFNPFKTADEMVAAMDKFGYDKLVICAAKMWSWRMKLDFIWDFTIEQVKEIMDKAGSDRVIGGAGYNPYNIEESLKIIEKAVKEYGFKYVYIHPHGFGIPPNHKLFYPLYAKCNELGIPVGMQIGHSAEPLPSWVGNPVNIDEVALDFPNLKINLSHTGYPWIDEWCSMVWKHPNVYGDISAYMPKGLDERIVKFMDGSRGRDKVMFGTNGMGLGMVQQLRDMEIRDEAKQKILRDNALEFFGL
jgi:predicted TIM-barrel fold metal-dependent hydrolase